MVCGYFQLHRHDIKCIREAFQRLEIKVELVFIVVNKMHRTRFFRQPNRNTMGELGYSRDNIPPGLLVDDVVVDPFGDDFYLASHRGLLVRSSFQVKRSLFPLACLTDIFYFYQFIAF